MIGLSDIKKRILRDLRHGHLDQFQIAAGLGEAPFRVRAELQDLKRDRFVRLGIDGQRVVWALTVRGEHAAWEQEELGV